MLENAAKFGKCVTEQKIDTFFGFSKTLQSENLPAD